MGPRSGVRAVEAADYLRQLRQPGHQYAGAGEGAGSSEEDVIRRIESAVRHAVAILKGSLPPITVQDSVNRLLKDHDAEGAWYMAERTRMIAERAEDHDGQAHWGRVVRELERQTGYRPQISEQMTTD